MSAPGPFLFQVLPPTVLSMQYVTDVADTIDSLVGTIAESYACRSETVMPAYPADAPVPVLSALYASTAGTAARTLALAAELFARSRKLRYEGIAIASRMPRMMMTTRSSMRVKPLSSPASRCRILLLIAVVLLPWERTDYDVARKESADSPTVGNPRMGERESFWPK